MLHSRSLLVSSPGILVALLLGVCGSGAPASADTINVTYGPAAGVFATDSVDPSGFGITYNITNSRGIPILFAAFEEPPGCPDLYTVGGPNAGEISNSGETMIADGAVGVVVVKSTDPCHKLCAYRTSTRNDLDYEGSYDDFDPCLNHVPTVSEWGMVAMVLLVLAAGTIVFRRYRMAKAV